MRDVNDWISDITADGGWEGGLAEARHLWNIDGQQAVESGIAYRVSQADANYAERPDGDAVKRAASEHIRAMRYARDELIAGRMGSDA